MESLWKATCRMPEFPTFEGEKSTDVLIIGGGITGILTAYFLHQKGVDYILVEKGRLCSSTTENTTAKITVQHGLIYNKLIKNFGTEMTAEYLKANQTAFNEYEELFKTIKCDNEVKDNYVYSLNDRQKLENEIKALDKIGYYTDICENTELPFATVGAVRFNNQMQFHPLKFLSQLCEGLNIYENTFVDDVKDNTAETPRGNIHAKAIVFATHFPFKDNHGGYPLKLYQHRSYVIAVENGKDIDGMYVDENHKGMSFRNYKDLLLIGGGGHRTGKQGGCWKELRDFASHNFPESKETYHWAAQDCMSLDDCYYIGRYSKSKTNWYTATGFNKWGMTGAMLSAMMLSDMVCGVQNEFESVFTPSRSILRPQLFINGFETVTNLLSITPKRCSHLGCALKWNEAEHSWDCACHGSRFNEKGEVLNNPANKEI